MTNSEKATPLRNVRDLLELSHFTKKGRMWTLLGVLLVINVGGATVVTWASNGGHWPTSSDNATSTASATADQSVATSTPAASAASAGASGRASHAQTEQAASGAASAAHITSAAQVKKPPTRASDAAQTSGACATPACTTAGYPVTIYILCLMCTALAAAPLIIFLLVGWYTRYREFQNSLKQEALAAYLQRFWSNSLIDALTDAAGETKAWSDPALATDPDWRKQSLKAPLICDRLFSRIYHDQYGLLPFVPAVCILLTFVYAAAAIVGWVYIASCCLKPEAPTCVFGLSTELVIASFGGAFMFVVSDTVGSVLKGSLNVSDVYWYSLRLLLAVPLALVANRITGSAGFHVAFALSLGTLPVNQLLKVIRRYGDPVTTPSAQKTKGAPDELLNLNGVTVAVAEAIQAQGLTSIEQVATADPVRLAIRTGFSFRFTLQLASQAIVRRHFGKTAENLAEIGLSTVVPIYLLVQALNGDKKPGRPKFDDGDAEKIITEAAGLLLPNDILAQGEAVTRMKFRQIAAEEYTQMLANITPLDPSL